MPALPPLPPMPAAERARLTGLVLAALDAAFGDAVQAVMLHGSALRGDFVPHYSDFDVHAFVKAGMVGPRTPDVGHTLALQRALGRIEPEAFAVSQVQLAVIDADGYPPEWVGHVPGTYAVIRGELPPSYRVPDAATLLAAARDFLPRVRREADALLERIADKADGRLASYVRLFGTNLKPLAYNAAILRGADPLRVWTLPLGEVLPPSPALVDAFQEIRRWDEVRRDPERLRVLLRTAYTAVGEVCALAAG